MLTGHDIKAARERLGESQAEFAVRLGATQPTIHRWETLGPPAKGPTRMLIERVLSEINRPSEKVA